MRAGELHGEAPLRKDRAIRIQSEEIIVHMMGRRCFPAYLGLPEGSRAQR